MLCSKSIVRLLAVMHGSQLCLLFHCVLSIIIVNTSETKARASSIVYVFYFLFSILRLLQQENLGLLLLRVALCRQLLKSLVSTTTDDNGYVKLLQITRDYAVRYNRIELSSICNFYGFKALDGDFTAASEIMSIGFVNNPRLYEDAHIDFAFITRRVRLQCCCNTSLQ